MKGTEATPSQMVLLTASLMVVLGGIPPAAQAVIFLNTDNPSYNTTEPGGPLAGSGWQYEGQWGGFLGTVIGSQYFLTATHVGGSVGQMFQYYSH